MSWEKICNIFISIEESRCLVIIKESRCLFFKMIVDSSMVMKKRVANIIRTP